VAFVSKPLQSADDVEQALAAVRTYTERETRRLLVLMAAGPMRDEYLDALGDGVRAELLDSGAAAREALLQQTFDAVAIDGSVGDFGPEDVIEATERLPFGPQLPVILAGPADPAAVARWSRPNDAFAVSVAPSLDAMINAGAERMHLRTSSLSERGREAARAAEAADRVLEQRKVLIVDDDMRNIFALATVLDGKGMTIVSAENGRDAVRLLAADPQIDIVLMDIMMPDMDGFETMREMRRLAHGKDVPMIAVTAKAMKGDREKCIAAGAWDYLSKPVDTRQLLLVMRGWLRR
jgi:CheY-like chemotaxis protein